MRKILTLLVLFSFLLVACSPAAAVQSTTVQPTQIERVVTQVVVVTATSPSTPQPTITIAVPITAVTSTTAAPLPANVPATSFKVRSVDLMKESQDILRNPLSDAHMQELVSALKPLKLTHLALSVPYDEPPDLPKGSAVKFSQRWVNVIRKGGMNVWFRPSFISFKGFYDAKVNPDASSYLPLITAYIEANASLFAPGDIFTPTPEPGGGRVEGVNCSQNCLFHSVTELADWTTKANQAAETGFEKLGLSGKITIGLYGHDGFLVWGDRNPDHEGQSDTLTNGKALITADNGNLCIDHYFKDGDPAQEFAKIRTYFPQVNLMICEWGPVDGQSPQYVDHLLNAALSQGITVFNWWQSGPDGGSEKLFTLDSSDHLLPTEYFQILQKYFNP